MKSQIQAWSRGDLEGFMAGYWHSKQLTFMSNSEETRGWEETLHRYRQRYQYGGNQMGKLAMSWIEPIHLLGADAAYMDGKWQLTMPDGKQPHGSFTLIFRKFPEGWRIIHDHTCAEESRWFRIGMTLSYIEKVIDGLVGGCRIQPSPNRAPLPR